MRGIPGSQSSSHRSWSHFSHPLTHPSIHPTVLSGLLLLIECSVSSSACPRPQSLTKRSRYPQKFGGDCIFFPTGDFEAGRKGIVKTSQDSKEKKTLQGRVYAVVRRAQSLVPHLPRCYISLTDSQSSLGK